MGTRSLTAVENYEGKEIICMYRQMDGYPSGHGRELVEFLKDFSLVNGISMNEKRKIANGMECLAAQIVAHFKTEPGGIYLYPPGTTDIGEEYIYVISAPDSSWSYSGDLFMRIIETYRGTSLYYGRIREIPRLGLEKIEKQFLESLDEE